jgi:hypothetical protein
MATAKATDSRERTHVLAVIGLRRRCSDFVHADCIGLPENDELSNVGREGDAVMFIGLSLNPVFSLQGCCRVFAGSLRPVHQYRLLPIFLTVYFQAFLFHVSCDS